MPEAPVRIPAATGRNVPRKTSRTNVVIGAVSASVACAGVFAGLGVQLLAPDEAPAPPAASASPAAPQPPALNQQGRIIAVSADSVTTRSADGLVQTFRVTPDTTALTPEGNHTVNPATTFAVDDEVEVAAIVQDGAPVATTVADRAVTAFGGPPMDSVTVQPASHVQGTASPAN